MKKTSKSQERNRVQSIDGNATCILTSILKKPSKVKLKTQRSVRFEEPQISYPSTFSLTSSLAEPLTATPTSIPLSNSPSKTRFSSTSPIKFPQTAESQFSKSQNETFNPTPVKVIKISKPGNQNFKESPKSGLKVLKLDCRDDKFYSKLNFFLNVKGTTSPERKEEENEKASKKKISLVKNRLYEETANAKTSLSCVEKNGSGKGNKGGKVIRGSYLLN